MQDRASRELARQWDARDPLARFRKLFARPPGQIYLDGGSLGLCSQDAERAVLRALGEWKAKANQSWSNPSGGWSKLSENLAARVAALVGAHPEEVAIANSSTLNLHQLLATVYRRQFHRPDILIDGFASGSDRAVLWSHLELRGLDPERQLLALPPEPDRLFDEARIEAAMAQPTLQLAIFPAVVWATGQLLDLDRICRAARGHGVLVGLDLSDSLGVIPHALAAWDADFAFWGHDSFVNAGPGAVAGLYLNRRYFDSHRGLRAGLAGRPGRNGAEGGDLAQNSQRADLAAALQLGPAPMLSLAPLDGALRMVEEAGLERLRAKSLHLTQFLRSAVESEMPGLHFITPREAERRGAHLALRHPAAREICAALRANGVSADFREPDIIALAPSPLYNSFTECWDAVQILRRVVDLSATAALAGAEELVS